MIYFIDVQSPFNGLFKLLPVAVIVLLRILIHEHVFPSLKAYFSNSLFPPIVDCMLCVTGKRKVNYNRLLCLVTFRHPKA